MLMHWTGQDFRGRNGGGEQGPGARKHGRKGENRTLGRRVLREPGRVAHPQRRTEQWPETCDEMEKLSFGGERQGRTSDDT